MSNTVSDLNYEDKNDADRAMSELEAQLADADAEMESAADAQIAADDGRATGVFQEAGREGRIRLNLNARRVAEAISGRIGSGELSGFFRRGKFLIRVPLVGEEGYINPTKEQVSEGIDNGPGQFLAVTEPALRRAIERIYDVGRWKVQSVNDIDHPDFAAANIGTPGVEMPKKTTREWSPADHIKRNTSEAVISDVDLTGYTPNLRVIKGVTHTPTIRQDGTVLDKPGYDDASGLLYLPDAECHMTGVPEIPTEAELTKARDLIVGMYADFPFVHEDDRANAYAALFTPAMRRYLGGNAPMAVIDATTAGTGKSLLAFTFGHIYGMTLQGDMPEAEELRKRVVSILATDTAPVVSFDNISGVVLSRWLEALLTATEVKERVLGVTDLVKVVNDRMFVLTGNNVKLGGDMRRRTVEIRMDAGMERPETRTGFAISDLKSYVRDERCNILNAVLTLARGWINAGAPQVQVTSDDFGPWHSGMRGLIKWAGFGGTVGGDAGRASERMSETDREYSALLHEVHRVFDGKWFNAIEILRSASNLSAETGIDATLLPGGVLDKMDHRPASAAKTLGHWLSNREGRIVGGLTVKRAPDKKKGNSYRIEVAPGWIPSVVGADGASDRVEVSEVSYFQPNLSSNPQ